MAQHTIMVKATSLGDAGGRIDYISNPNRQEHLEAVYYSTDDETFWKALADHCQEQAKYSQTKNAVEAKEWIVPLANELFEMYDPAVLVRMASERIKEKTGTENIVAAHWNKKESNFHLHIISAENKEINQVKEGAVLTRNTYFDENGKRSTKKNCVDQNGDLKLGCTFYKKGEQKIDQIRFGAKIEEIGSKGFLQELKRDMVIWQNALLQEDRFRMFDRSLYIAQQHIGPQDKQDKLSPELVAAIEAKNQLAQAYNAAVDECLRLSALMQQLQRELENMRRIRKDIKKYALKEDWEKAITHYVKVLADRAEQWIGAIQYQKEQERIEARKQAPEPSERKVSLLDQIASAKAEQRQQKPTERIQRTRDDGR